MSSGACGSVLTMHARLRVYLGVLRGVGVSGLVKMVAVSRCSKREELLVRLRSSKTGFGGCSPALNQDDPILKQDHVLDILEWVFIVFFTLEVTRAPRRRARPRQTIGPHAHASAQLSHSRSSSHAHAHTLTRTLTRARSHAHVHTFTFMLTRTRTRAHVHAHAQAGHPSIHSFTRALTQTRTVALPRTVEQHAIARTYAQSRAHACTCAQIGADTCARARTHAHIYGRAHKQASKQTYKRARTHSRILAFNANLHAYLLTHPLFLARRC
eukprot:6191184-Pleurochrysis_carterae.AAC.3